MAGPARAFRLARRLYPAALAAYRRWQSLTPEEKERYRRIARQYAERGRGAADRGLEAARRVRERRGGPPRGRPGF